MTGTDLRELAARVAHDMPVDEVRDVLPGKLLEAADALDEAKMNVPQGYEVIGLGDLADTHEMNKRIPLRTGKPEWWIIWYDGSPQSGPFETAIAATEAVKGEPDAR